MSHDFILPSDSPCLTTVGSALPDLWSLLEKRPLPLVVQRNLDASDDVKSKELADGIRSHLQADACFHSLPRFREQVQWLAPQLQAAWQGIRHPSLAAHILVEMILDSWIITRYPHRLDTYYNCFTQENIDFAAYSSANDPDMEKSVRAMLNRFATVQFLRDYKTLAGVVHRFSLLLLHSPFAPTSAPDPKKLIPVTHRASESFAPHSRDMLETVRTSQAPIFCALSRITPQTP